jgi:hypothetical protein
MARVAILLVDAERGIPLVLSLLGDGDGRDDRDRIAWMIFRNGGTVDYDLPVAGPASGAIHPGTTWYVHDLFQAPGSKLPAPFIQAEDQVIKQLRHEGIPPLPLEKLLARLRGE